jgi:hypothetical protein
MQQYRSAFQPLGLLDRKLVESESYVYVPGTSMLAVKLVLSM